MTIPAPSAGTKPSRVLSKGLLAEAGNSFCSVRAFMAQKPANPNLLIGASAPPEIITSATPLRITSAASPIA